MEGEIVVYHDTYVSIQHKKVMIQIPNNHNVCNNETILYASNMHYFSNTAECIPKNQFPWSYSDTAYSFTYNL